MLYRIQHKRQTLPPGVYAVGSSNRPLLNSLYHCRVEQRADIAHVAGVSFGDFAEDAAHDFAGASFGQARDDLNLVGLSNAANFGHHGFDDTGFGHLDFEFGSGHAVLTDDVGVNTLALHLVRIAHHGTFHHVLALVDGVFDFGGAEAVAAHIDNVIDATDDAVEAILVAPGPVAGEIVAGVRRELGLAGAFVVAPGGANHPRPAALDDQVALLVVAFDFAAILV